MHKFVLSARYYLTSDCKFLLSLLQHDHLDLLKLAKPPLKSILQRLIEHQTFTYDESRQILIDITQGKYKNAEMAGIMLALSMRAISLDELAGFRDAMLEQCVKVDLGGYQTIDLCGTGGDGKHAFNISTLASFIVAGTGTKVAKHGNYGISSVSGSSSVMQELGLAFSAVESELKESVEKANICFLHAPLFHPAMKQVAGIRKELGIKTFFNLLGPMVNPAGPAYHLTGVFSLELARAYYYLFQAEGRNFTIVHSTDGYDEVSLTAATKIYNSFGEDLKQPGELAFQVKPNEIEGGSSPHEAKAIFETILYGRGTKAQNAVVFSNAAFALKTVTPEASWENCYAQATESLQSGRALECLQTLLAVNNKYA